MNCIEIKNLIVSYDSDPVLWDINLNLPNNKLIALVGPNGAGKSTLIKSIINLIKPISGEVKFPLLSNIKNKIAYVPQSSTVDWDFPATVLDIVMMGRYGHLGWFKKPGIKEKEMALEVLSKVGMIDYQKRQINELSGGQQQRIFLARALIQQADIYLLDEPLKGIDVSTEEIIMSLLKELKDDGKTIIVVHHDLKTIKKYFDYVVFINKIIVDNGDVNLKFTNNNINETYKNCDYND